MKLNYVKSATINRKQLERKIRGKTIKSASLFNKNSFIVLTNIIFIDGSSIKLCRKEDKVIIKFYYDKEGNQYTIKDNL